MDTLQALFDSTAALYKRFDLDAESIPPAKRRRIFMEEALELMEASTSDELSFGSNDEDVLADEAADVMVTVCGLLLAHMIDREYLSAAIERVIAKNDAKTLDTHALINGKITRKQRPTP